MKLLIRYPEFILPSETPTDVIDNFTYERTLWQQGYQHIMGLDEVGRGCLAGPVVAAGVILPKDFSVAGITDSKTIPEHKRDVLAELIKEKALAYSICLCSPKEVDELNIYWASYAAMDKCISTSEIKPEYALVDGNRFPSKHILPYTCIVKGDSKSVSIGAASILAKVHRDKLMRTLHNEFPWYGWDTNVGYATKKHYAGLAEKGITMHHRRSFKLGTEKLYEPQNQT